MPCLLLSNQLPLNILVSLTQSSRQLLWKREKKTSRWNGSNTIVSFIKHSPIVFRYRHYDVILTKQYPAVSYLGKSVYRAHLACFGVFFFFIGNNLSSTVEISLLRKTAIWKSLLNFEIFQLTRFIFYPRNWWTLLSSKVLKRNMVCVVGKH